MLCQPHSFVCWHACPEVEEQGAWKLAFIYYLPLAHIYERANQIVMAHFGVAVGFYQGDVMKLMDDMAALRPTIFCSVPRPYNRIYDGITNAVKTSGGLREQLFNAAYSSTMDAIMNEIEDKCEEEHC